MNGPSSCKYDEIILWEIILEKSAISLTLLDLERLKKYFCLFWEFSLCSCVVCWLTGLKFVYGSRGCKNKTVKFETHYNETFSKGSYKKNCVFCDIDIKGGWVPVSKPNF